MIHLVRALIAAALVVASGCAGASPALPIAPNDAARPNAPVLAYGVYAWNAKDVFTRWQVGTLWSYLASKHVDDVLLGFTDADIAKYSTPSGAAQINSMIAQGAQHTVRFELLLGDPSWILPAGVSSLTAIITKLHRVNFAGLNLDLEPNEVKSLPVKQVVKDLVAAMRAYISASQWPVTLDANYIYMRDATLTGGYCLPCGLQKAGLLHVDLMTYISDPATVAAVDGPILTAYPKLTFAIAQSVEPPAIVPPRDSYWSDGFTRFYTQMQRLDGKFRGYANYRGIAIQSLQYLELMKP